MTTSDRSPLPSAARKTLIDVFLALAVVESAAALLFMALIPGDARNALVFGFSAQRMALMALAAAGMVLSAVFLIKKPAFLYNLFAASLSKQRWMFFLCVALAVLFWQFSFIPHDLLGIYLAYYKRVQPLLLWFTVLLLEFAVLIASGRFLQSKTDAGSLLPAGLIKPFMWSLAVFILFCLIVAVTGLGIGPGNNYWNKVGVPLLGGQILAAILVGLLEVYFEKRRLLKNLIERKPWLVDVVFFVLLWVIAAAWWYHTPMTTSRFNSQVLPPNYASYPFSDAQEYDLNAQRVLQGQGIGFGYTDKAFHITFLVILHVLAGQDFNQVLLLQVCLLGIIPALLYLLGKSLYNRPFGLMIAALDLFYEVNAIQSTNLIQVSNVKMMLSEPLTRAGVIVVCLLAAHWLQQDRRQWWRGLILTAGAAGLATLMRLNVAAALPVIMLAAAVQMKWKWRRVLWAWVVAAACFSLALAPWVARNSVVAENPILFIKSKLHGVVWRKRLTPMIQTNTAPTALPTRLPGSAPAATPLPSDGQPPEEEQSGGFAALFQPFAANYAHNLVSSALMIPPVLEQGDIFHIVREAYWDSEWRGQFTPWGVPLLALNLALISLGIAAAWHRRKMAGIFPLLFFLAYHATNAVSVVSGGRYIVPVDWVLPFYYMLGAAELMFAGLRLFGAVETRPEGAASVDVPAFRFDGKAFAPVLIMLAVIGSLPWALESVFPFTHPERPVAALRESLKQHLDWQSTGLTPQDVDTFLMDPRAVLLEGQAFYPRFFQPGQGDTNGSSLPFGIKTYPHLGFIVLGGSKGNVDLYIEKSPAVFPNSADVLVLGCKEETQVQAALLVILNPDRTLARSDFRGLSCPLAGPK